jgi:hypothetical protein
MKFRIFAKLPVTLACLTLLGLSGEAQALEMELIQHSAANRSVDVTGTGTIYTAPEEVVIEMGVRTWNKDLRICYKENQRLVSQVLEVAKKHKIEFKNIQASEISVLPTYPYSTSSSRDCNPDGYSVNKDITLVVKDSRSVQSLLTDAIENGANKIERVDFRIENPRKFKDEARMLAITAAQEKAAAMAKQVNAKLGKVIRLKEVASNISGMRERDRYSFFPNTNNNISTVSQLSGERGEEFAPGDIATGQLRVTSDISATFELVD